MTIGEFVFRFYTPNNKKKQHINFFNCMARVGRKVCLFQKTSKNTTTLASYLHFIFGKVQCLEFWML